MYDVRFYAATIFRLWMFSELGLKARPVTEDIKEEELDCQSKEMYQVNSAGSLVRAGFC